MSRVPTPISPALVLVVLLDGGNVATVRVHLPSDFGSSQQLVPVVKVEAVRAFVGLRASEPSVALVAHPGKADGNG